MAPAGVAQLAADALSSAAPATSFGGVHAGWAGAMAPTVAHMSQVLLPNGMAQPHRLQTAICGISGRAARTAVTIVQQLWSPAFLGTGPEHSDEW
jgi:copper oxidase (laccase) domain-containing protein